MRWFIFASIRLALAIFFRRIEVTGDVPGRTTRATLLYGNHHNGLIDAALLLASTPATVSVIGKSTLWKILPLRPFLAATRAVPVLRRQDLPPSAQADNQAMFARVIARLDEGGNLLIFPEGISHNAPELAPFKTGAARILLGSVADDVRAQPVHLGFDQKAIFRSRALVHFGPPLAVAPFRARLEAGEDEREVVRSLTAAMQEALEAQVPLAADAQQLLERVATLAVQPESSGSGREPALEARREAFLRARRAYQLLQRDEPRVRAVAAEVDGYFEALFAAGLADHEVVREPRRRRAWAELARHVATVLLVLPLALVGLVLFAPPYHFVRLVTARMAREEDIVSSVKLMAGYIAFPVCYVAYVCLLALLPSAWMFVVGAVFVLASAFAALAFLERVASAGRVAGWLRMRLLRNTSLAALRERRAALVTALAELEEEALARAAREPVAA